MTSTENNDRPLGPLQRRRWVLAALAGYWLLIFTLTHIPIKKAPLPGQTDKLAHLLMYGGLAFLLTWGLRLRGHRGVRQFVLVVVIAAVYGIIDELLQIPVGRHADVVDWLADCTGVLLGFTSFHTLRLTWYRLRRT